MRECEEDEITVAQLLRVVHKYTERIKIHVITYGNDGSTEDKVKNYYITENFSEDRQEEDRVLKYYADVPVYNLHMSPSNNHPSSPL